MEVTGTMVPAVKITLTQEEAKELAHTLLLYNNEASSPGNARGTVIDERLTFNRELIHRIDVATGGGK